MYKLKENVNPEDLRKYGFKIGREYPDNERCICNDKDRDDFWLIATMDDVDPDEAGKIYYADDDYDQAIWSIHVQSNARNRMWIECVPSCTYHIDNSDMERMFFVLKNMIEDGIIEDNYGEED